MIHELYKIILPAGLRDRTTSANPPNLQNRFIDNVISSTNQLVEITWWVVYWYTQCGGALRTGNVPRGIEVMMMVMMVVAVVMMVVAVVMVCELKVFLAINCFQ